MRVTKFNSVMLASALGLCLAATAAAGVVTGPTVPAFTTTGNAKDNVLTSATPTFSADLSTYATFTSQVHSLLGDGNTDTSQSGIPGQADFQYQDASSPDALYGDITLPYAMVGQKANGFNGTVLYKFVVQSGYQTAAGGTITADMYFRQDPNDGGQGQNAWIGVTTNTPTIAGDLSGFGADAGFTTVTMKDLFGPQNAGFKTYTGPATLSIPAGATTFYVAFSDVDKGIDGNGSSSARLAISSLNVNANLVAVPEPASLSLLALGAAACIRRRRR
jgi:hypothetical protein